MLYDITEFRETTFDEDTKLAIRPATGDKVGFQDICRVIPYRIAG